MAQEASRDELFAAALRHFLSNKEKGLTQMALAEKVGVSKSYIYKLSRGLSPGTEELRRQVSAVYGFGGPKDQKSYEDFFNLGKQLINTVEKFQTPYKPPDANRRQVASADYRRKEDSACREIHEIAYKIVELKRKRMDTYIVIAMVVDSLYRWFLIENEKDKKTVDTQGPGW